ncbi:MAG: ribonuclease H-like domain-containing protein [Chloroflexota bacterium]|nr:ribonuclease H-like domain-containing protein [Chloroflexota bacterium]
MGKSFAGNTVFFDVETQYLAEEVGGWNFINRMKLAAAVIYSTDDGAFHHYTEETVDDLIAKLLAADLVVGYNVLRFDYIVLSAYTDCTLHRLPTVDMLDHLYRALGLRLKLDNVAQATLGTSKSADGFQAVRWYRQGDLDKVLAYCQQDVEITRRLYEFGRERGYVQYRDKRWRLRQVPVRW